MHSYVLASHASFLVSIPLVRTSVEHLYVKEKEITYVVGLARLGRHRELFWDSHSLFHKQFGSFKISRVVSYGFP